MKQLQDRVAQLARDYGMAERLIASRAELEDLVRYRRGLAPAPALQSDWRSAELTPAIEELIDVG